jgi:hypothetical protein
MTRYVLQRFRSDMRCAALFKGKESYHGGTACFQRDAQAVLLSGTVRIPEEAFYFFFYSNLQGEKKDKRYP